MRQETEQNPINAALIPFKARVMRIGLAKKLGVDVSGMVTESRRLLCLFGAMVMGTAKKPELWRETNIMQAYYPCLDQWEMFFDSWMQSVSQEKKDSLNAIGINVDGLDDPYEILLLEILDLVYGAGVGEEVRMWLYENETAYYELDGKMYDLRGVVPFSEYFKEKYDTQTFTESYERGYRGFDN